MLRQHKPARTKIDRGSDGKRTAAVPPALEHLQGQAGNRAVGLLVQRVADGGQPASVLMSPILANDTRVQQAVRNAPPLHRNETGEGVARLQHALVSVGYDLPRSARAAGDTDGIYGPETESTVRRFQGDHGVAPVGGHEAGHKTLTALDQAVVDLGPVAGGSGQPGSAGTLSKTRQAGPREVPGKSTPLPPATQGHKAPASAAGFVGKTFTEPVFRPESGGAQQFFARYTQATEQLLIGVKARADFRHSASIVQQNGVPVATAEPGVDKFHEALIGQINNRSDAGRIGEVERWRWQDTPPERPNWAAALRSSIETTWSEAKTGIQFVLNKPGFPASGANVAVQVEVDDGAGKQVTPGPQIPVTDRHLDMVVWKEPPDIPESAESTGSLDNRHSAMRLSSNSVGQRRDNPLIKIWDPNVFLSNVQSWAEDHKSAATALGSKAAVDNKVPDAAGEPISMIVRGPDAGTRSTDTVDLIKAITAGCGDASRIRRLGELDGPRGAAMFVGDGMPQTTAAHEFGHLFGLGDEYAAAAESRPPGTDATHAKLAANMGPKGPAGAKVESNDNIMSEGSNVRPQHYAVFLDALRKVTGLKEWQLR